jgi:DNA-binding Lrp family transcriptional regulator
MMLCEGDRALLTAVAGGLPLVPRPYAEIGEQLGLSEDDVLARLRRLATDGVIKRLGIVVRHHELGWNANAMTVWDVPAERVGAAGACLRELSFVTLCYRRPRRPPSWPYNLFCMIHGRDRQVVLEQVEEATRAAKLDGIRRDVLFSVRRFKQQGAHYAALSDPC